jgi:riboflavin kinase/FMN adenylyltransferase
VQQKPKIAIGGFDGVHLAHQKLISISDEVLIIEKNSSLTPYKDRCDYINKPCHFYLLDEIKNLTYLEFIYKIKKEFNPSAVVVGYDFRFGKNREGDIEKLKKFFEVIIVEEIKIENTGVHSKIIRKFIKQAQISKATKFLNHTYKIKGVQIDGQGIGKKKLLPTINLQLTNNYLIPKEGVYLTLTNKIPSITFIGIRSTDNNFAIETHLLDRFDKSKTYEIEFIDFLRENRKFDSLDKLKKVIITDKEKAINFFRRKYEIR